MLGDLPSIVPRRNYDIRTQCLKGTCSSSELPRRLACFLPRRCAPMPRLFVHVSPETSHGKTVTSPIIGLDPLFWFSPDRADDGVRTRDLLLGKQACCHCTTSALPCFFSDTSHGGDVLSAGRKRMAGFRVDAPGITPREKVWIPSSSNALRPFLPVITDVLIPLAGNAGHTA